VNPLKKFLNEIGLYLFANLITLVTVLYKFKVNFSQFNIPWVINGDTVDLYARSQSIKQTGSLLFNNNLGWPYSLDFSPFRAISIFDYVSLSALNTNFDAITSINALVLINFMITTSATIFLLRKLKFNYAFSLILSLALSLSPWHFQRALWHVTVANYAAIPLLIIVIILIQENTKRNLIKISLILVYIASSFAYYFVITEILLFVYALYALFNFNKLKIKVSYLFYYLMIIPVYQLVQFVWQNNNSLYTQMSNPTERVFEYVERYSGSFIALFMPNPYSTIPFLAQIRNSFDQQTQLGLGEGGPWNSVLGIVALVFTFGLILYLTLSNKEKQFFDEKWNTDASLIKVLILFFIVSLSLYWTTGLGSIFSFFITDFMRSWGRLFIYILYFAVFITSLFLRRINSWQKLSIEAKRTILVSLALIVLLDQFVKPQPINIEANQKQYEEISDFMQIVEKKLEPNCSILQLPVMKYPEAGLIGDVVDYDPFWLYIANPNFNYSYGALKGTQQAKWQDKIETKSISKIAAQAASVGYCAVIVDFRAYANTAETGNAWIKAAGKPIAVSKNTRLAAFKIDPNLSNNSSKQSLLTLTWLGKADTGLIQNSKQIDFYDREFKLYVLNPTKEKIEGQIKFGIRGGKCDPSQNLTITDQDNDVLFDKQFEKFTQQVEIDLSIKPLEQQEFKFNLSSSSCSIEWFSDALISIRNERFILN
jgi:hypothetical protein